MVTKFYSHIKKQTEQNFVSGNKFNCDLS